MSTPLIIWLPENLDEPWAYYKSASEQGWASNADEISALSALAQGECWAVCPGTWMRVFAHSLPEMKASERLSAAGFAIEEKLAAPLSNQHVVLGAGEDQRVGVIARTRMDEILSQMDNANIAPTKLIAEYEAFPASRGAIRTWNRDIHPGSMGYSLDSGDEGDNPLSLIPEMNFDGALNYAQGDFVRRGSNLSFTKNLGRLAALLLVSGLVWLGWHGAEARAMNKQTEAIKLQTTEVYTQATGQSAPVNPALAVTRALRQKGSVSADFMDLSAAFNGGLAQVDGILIDSVRFNAQRSELDVKLIYPDFDSATALEQIFTGTSGNFQSGSVREQSGELIGEGKFTLGAAQ